MILPTWADISLKRIDYESYSTWLGGLSVDGSQRGTGLSDRQLEGTTHEDRCQDLIAVMDDAGSATAVLFWWVDSAPVSLMTAALYPHRVSAVIAGEVLAVDHRDADHPFELDQTILRLAQEAIAKGAWGRGLRLRALNPHIDFTNQQIAAHARFESLAATPKAASSRA